MVSTPPRQDGLTLLELMVAIAVFAVAGSLAYGGLHVVLETRERTDAVAEQMRATQLAFTLLGSDVEQALARSYRDGFGDPQPPLAYDPLADPPRLTLVRPGDRTSTRQPLQRVGYEVLEGTLYRLTWPVLDGAPEDASLRVPLLDLDADADPPWDIVFIEPDAEGNPRRAETWPPRQGGGGMMPTAVEITLVVPRLGAITRVHALPRGY